MTANESESLEDVGSHHLPAAKCPNCSAELLGEFCHRCGQRGHTHHRLADLVSELFEGLSHFDNKLWRTVPLLIRKPGQLADEWLSGRHVRYMAPLSTFLFAVFLLFLSVTLSGHHLIDGRTLVDLLGDRTKSTNTNPELYAYKIEGWAYKLSVLFVPFTVISLGVIFSLRRSANLYQHVVVALYGLALVSLLSAIILWLVDFFPGKTEYLTVVLGLAHIAVLLKDAYGLSWVGAGLRSLALAFLSLLWLVLYGWMVMQIGLGL